MAQARKLTITLSAEEQRVLHLMAQAELRFPEDQVRWLLRQEALQRGLLTSQPKPTPLVGAAVSGD